MQATAFCQRHEEEVVRSAILGQHGLSKARLPATARTWRFEGRLLGCRTAPNTVALRIVRALAEGVEAQQLGGLISAWPRGAADGYDQSSCNAASRWPTARCWRSCRPAPIAWCLGLAHDEVGGLPCVAAVLVCWRWTARGRHALTCALGGGRVARHTMRWRRGCDRSVWPLRSSSI